MAIPKEILDKMSSDKSMDWVEEHDLIPNLNKMPYDVVNQLNWWEMNCRIRKAFNTIQKEIKKEMEQKKNISPRLISWVRIAKLAGCDRNTVKHPKRKFWTRKKREELIKEIKGNQGSKSIQKENSIDVEEILKIKLEKSKQETARWLIESQDAKEKIKLLNQLINRKQVLINEKDREINELRRRLKEMMQV
ncbi:hypothetical protein [Priestia megaterium]|uniref:hypothetical protein n=1 Tax=Priestia megaterium TaxID=1404 RepID=UPI000C9CF933|nr:hypothetical protein [Priestia megaterium]PNE08458.1 hypothetical protein C1Y47_06640 [Priestia megaterium]